MIFACNLMLAPAKAKELKDVTNTPDFVSTVWASYTATALQIPTLAVTPSLVPTFTDTPFPTATVASVFAPPTFADTRGADTQTFSLSFYDPHIGALIPEIASVNCLEFDFGMGDCVSKVHHGMDNYHAWIGKGAACSSLLAYDTVFYVHSPKQIEGVWRCIDVGALDRSGLHYIDFMLTYPDMIWTGEDLNDFPWSSDVVIEILSAP